MSTQAVAETRGPRRSHLRISEIARMTGVSYWSIFRLVDRGDLDSVRVGRSRLVPVAEYERFFRCSYA